MDAEFAPLLAALAAEGVDLLDVKVHSGWESWVVESGDGWMYRFPRPHVDFERELAVLDLLASRLPVPIPRVERVGRRTPYAAYRKLEGFEFDVATFPTLPGQRQDGLARSLAGFLVAMHGALTAEEIEALALPSLGHAGAVAGAAARLDRVPPIARPEVEALLAEFCEGWVDVAEPEPMVVLHNDFHFGNLVLDAPDGEVAGVWDFSCVQLGEPSFDVRYLHKCQALLEKVAEQYERLSGRALDVRAATSAARLERVTDALDLDEPETMPAIVAGWR